MTAYNEINGIPGMKDGRAETREELMEMETRLRETAPHIVSVSFRGVRAEVLLHALEEKFCLRAEEELSVLNQ